MDIEVESTNYILSLWIFILPILIIAFAILGFLFSTKLINVLESFGEGTISLFGRGLKAFVDFFIFLYDTAVDWLKDAWNAVKGWGSDIIAEGEKIFDLVEKEAKIVVDRTEEIYEASKAEVIRIVDGIKNEFFRVFNSVKQIYNNFIEIASSIFNSAKDIIVRAFRELENITDRVVNFIRSLFQNIENAVKGVIDFIEKAIKFIIDLPGKLIDGIENAVKGIFNDLNPFSIF